MLSSMVQSFSKEAVERISMRVVSEGIEECIRGPSSELT